MTRARRLPTATRSDARRHRRPIALALGAALMATVLAVTGTATPAAAAGGFGSPTILSGVNAGSPPTAVTGPDGTNMVMVYERNALKYFTTTRIAGQTTWSAPIPLSTPSTTMASIGDMGISDDLNMRVLAFGGASASTADKLVVWTKTPTATTWPTPQVVSYPATATAGGGPVAKFLPDGSVIFAWNDAATNQIKAARLPAGASTFGPTQNVSPAGEGYPPRLWTSRAGHVGMMWFKRGSTDWATSFAAPGGNFGAVQVIPRNGIDDATLGPSQMAIGDDGRATLVADARAESGNFAWHIAAWDRPAGGTWGAGTTVSDPAAYTTGFGRVGIDGEGNTTIAYEHTQGNTSTSGIRIDAVRRGPGINGPWSAPVALSTGSLIRPDVTLAVAQDGTVGVTWAFWDGQYFDFGEPGTVYNSAVVTQVATLMPNDLTWNPTETVSARHRAGNNPAVTVGNNSVVVAWWQILRFGSPYDAAIATNGPAVAPAATLTVNSTGDKPALNPGTQGCKTGAFISGKAECTLRAAIQTVNAGKGNEIRFNIASSGAPNIATTSKLPALIKTSIIDGTTQAGGVVELTGTADVGLTISGPNVTVKGLAISGFTSSGLLLDGAAGAIITKNRFGTDGAGTTYRASGNGISVTRSANATIGGAAAADGNQIVTGDGRFGVTGIADAARPITGLKVRHNTIGTEPTGTTALGPGPGTGVLIASTASGTSTISDNLVVAHRAGVVVAGAGSGDTVVASNTIGLDRTGLVKLGELVYGVRLDGSPRSKVSNNTIATNGYDISVAGSVQGVISETTYALYPPTATKTTEPITGGNEQVTGNRVGVLSNGTKAPGSGSAGISVWSGSDGVLVQDNTVAGHSSTEITLYRGKDHQVLKNKIGLDPTGATVLGGNTGLLVSGTTDAQLGTSNVTGNTIGGVSANAILLNGLSGSPATGTRMVGNRIGLLADGTSAATVGGGGVVLGTAPDTTVGPDNVIANTAGGVSVNPRATRTTITGNWIGTDATGVTKAPNRVGIELLPPTGSDPLTPELTITGNTVSGNTLAGISVTATGTKVLANRVGVAPTTLVDVGNAGPGIAATGDQVEVRGNIVGHNAGTGVTVGGTGVVVADNQIGQPSTAETDIGNDGNGISLLSGTAAVTSNLLARNGDNGIQVAAAATAELRLNRISSNTNAGVSTKSSNITIRDNRIGVPATGDAARPNKVGIQVNAGTALIKTNRIANNTNEGVAVTSSAKATLTANPIFTNGGVGILASAPAPAAPVLSLAVRRGSGDTSRTWLAVQAPDTLGTLEAFGNASCSDPEGKVPLTTKSWKGGTKPTVMTLRGNDSLLGYTVTFTDTDGRTSAFSTCATVNTSAPDEDSDGIPTSVELLGPWPGAAGDDRFAAVPTDNGTFVGLEASGGVLRSVTPADAPGGKPAGLELPFGLLSWELHVSIPGQAATVNVLVDGGNVGTAYWRFGPPDVDRPAAWYRFDYVTASDTGAKRITKTIAGTPYAGWELNLQDGSRGDDDNELNQVIVDPGGAGFGGVDDFSCPTAKGNARYVCRTYAFGLGRNPDAAGQAYWVRKLDAGTSRSAVMQSFITGSESRRVVVQRLYSFYLHRGPDAAGLTYWADRLGKGTTPEALRINLASSSEVYRTSGGTNRDYAAALFELMVHRPATETEADYLTALLDGGMSRSTAVTSLIRSAEGRAAVIADAYALYLERPPTPSEVTYWSTKMAAGLSELDLYVKLASTTEFATT